MADVDVDIAKEINARRTFAIISHPDAGKTTITEKLLLLGQAIQMAGTIKGKKSGRMATSDWMKMEQERGISITTSVMQFTYNNTVINLLDTPGHEDFSEDTYRTLTAVDSVLMVIDGTKGVEDRTIKLMEICRLRNTPIFTFVNKMDRDSREQIEVIDEIESTLQIQCSPITWPLGTGKLFKGVYNLYTDTIHVFTPGTANVIPKDIRIADLHSDKAKELLGEIYKEVTDDVQLIAGASHTFDHGQFLKGAMSPVFYGTALSNFGVREMLDYFIQWAPSPLPRQTNIKLINPNDPKFSGFVFKIQANMDPKHRDRIAFLRVCSGNYTPNIKMFQVRTNKQLRISDAVTFFAGERSQTSHAVAGDIIGLHNHGTIQIGDTFTENDKYHFTGIPHFAPELFRKVRLNNPLKMKQLKKGLQQLSEEGATQLFMPLTNNDLILGAIGSLQFDVIIRRLKDEYDVDAIYENIKVSTARWVEFKDIKLKDKFNDKYAIHLAKDGGDHLTYLAPTKINLQLIEERYPNIEFHSTREH